MRRRAVLSVVVLLALGLASCGDDDDGDDQTSAAAGDTTETTAEGDTETTEAGGTGDGAEAATVAVADTDLGQVLVDGDGMTLYLFTRDTADASACTGSCAESWPPLAAGDEPVAGEGVDEAKLATIERDDGTAQVSYNGHPLYTYAPDEQPGDVKGQGLNEVWWVVSPEGEAVSGTAEDAAATERSPGY